MKIVMTLPSAATEDPLHRRFHLALGVAEVVDRGSVNDADWIIESETNEFWWPRRGSFRDLLGGVPETYGVVDAIVRRLVGRDGVYRLRHDPAPERKAIRRAGANCRSVRGWYPIEVLTFAEEDVSQREIERRLREGFLAEDTRLRDALRGLEENGRLELPEPSLLDEAELAADVAALCDAEVIDAQRQLADVEQRLAALESLTPLRIERRLRMMLRRSR